MERLNTNMHTAKLQACFQFYISNSVRLWGIKPPYFSPGSNYKCVTDSRGAVHGPRPRLLGSPHQHCQTRGSLSRCSNSHYEHYARYEWMVLEPMGASPTLQQQPRNRPFGGVTCSQVTCLHCRGTCR